MELKKYHCSTCKKPTEAVKCPCCYYCSICGIAYEKAKGGERE